MSTLNANVYNRHCTNVVIHYLPFKVLGGDILFGVVIFKCRGKIVYWLQCLVRTTSLSPRPVPQRIYSPVPLMGMRERDTNKKKKKKKKTSNLCNVQREIVCLNPELIMNWYFPVCHSPLSEVTLIFIHCSRLCVNFPSLIQICSEWSTNPSAGLAARMIARPVWRENYKSNTPGYLFSFCVMSIHKTSRNNFVQMKYFPSSICVFLFCAVAHINQVDSCGFTRVHELACDSLHDKHRNMDARLHYTYDEILFQSLTLRP